MIKRKYIFILLLIVCSLLLSLSVTVTSNAQYYGLYGGGYGAYGGGYGLYGGGYGLYGGGYGAYGGSYGLYGGGYGLYGSSMTPGTYPNGFSGYTIPFYGLSQLSSPLYLTYAQHLTPSSNLQNLARNFYSWANIMGNLGGFTGFYGGFW